jgi:hypothetical protein
MGAGGIVVDATTEIGCTLVILTVVGATIGNKSEVGSG